MITRSEYMAANTGANYKPDDHTAHRAYFAQFVDEDVRTLVARSIGVETILASKDEHMNDIALRWWDMLVPKLGARADRLLKECGDYLTLGNGVCILKEAARQIKEGRNA